MRDQRLRGVLPVLAVPFTSAGDLDVPGFSRIVAHQIDCGVTGMTLFGIASEFAKLTDAERATLRDAMLEQTRTHAGLAAIVSLTAHSAEIAVRDARSAVAAGADALNVLPPHLFAPRADAVLAHIEAVLAAVDVPVVVQYAPAQTGTRLDVGTIARWATTYPHLAAIKVEAVPPGRMISQLVASDAGVDALVGYAGLSMLDALDRGAVGVQPGCSFTEIYLRVLKLWRDGERDAARTLHADLTPFLSAWMAHVELIIQVEKSILMRRGLIDTDLCRAPGWPLDAVENALVDRFLDGVADQLISPPAAHRYRNPGT